MSDIMFSCVVPVYNDAYLAEKFSSTLQQVMSEYFNDSDVSKKLELIFVNDGSADSSLSQLLHLKEKYAFVKVVNLSRNFGQHQAIAAGMSQAQGEYIIRTNIDMQDPLSELPRFLDAINGNCDAVFGLYENRKSPWFTRMSSRLHGYVFKLLTGCKSPLNVAPLRVMTKRYVKNYLSFLEKHRFPQGIIEALGFNKEYITIKHRQRVDKRSSYNFFSRLRLSVNGILYFSERPIQFFVCLGFLGVILGIAGSAFVFIKHFVSGYSVPGYASIVLLALIGFSLQVAVTGLIGLYIGKIFTEVKNRPAYIIEDIY